MKAADRSLVLGGLFFEGPDFPAAVERFAVLLALSVVIASLGLLLDSAAVVIGAMLVAPLMTPILALAMALVLAAPQRQLSALVMVVVGWCGAIAIAWVISAVIPAARIAVLPNELLARTTPTLLDLAVGVAAGAAGAYVTIRPRALSALPGVAIAVALVPPLAAIGILLQRGDDRLAGGAALLLLTNLAAIVLAAMLVFLAAGFTPAAATTGNRRRMRRGIASAAIGVLAVAYPLEHQSAEVIRMSTEQARVNTLATAWLKGSDIEIQAVTLDPADRFHITLDLIGSPPLPPQATLAGAIARAVDHRVTLTLLYTERSQLELQSTKSPGGSV